MENYSLVDQAFKALDRADFLPSNKKKMSELDRPVDIGFSQTNSQPSTVKMMLKWLDAQAGDKVLDVGSGSGWTTALLSKIVSDSGKVYAVEKIKKLLEFGKQNCKNIGLKNVEFYSAGKNIGLPKHAPYDRILVSASTELLPETLIDQLKIHGKLVIPVHNDILEILKTKDHEYSLIKHPGFIFVPLVV